MKNLNGKVAIVSGGSRDIGKEIALKLAALGAKVAINYCNNEANAKEVLAQIKESGGDAIIVKGDMTLQDDVQTLVSEAQGAFGSAIDVLVNVAGGLVARKTLEEMDEDFFNQVMRLNMNSTFLLTKAIVPFMPEGSAIVNLASQAGRDGGGPGSSAYATSKGAVVTFTRSMAKELGPRNIRVNAVCPGMIDTTFHDTFTKDAVRTNVAAATPLRREGRAAEVADLVCYLASSEASFVTGTNYDINGGMLFS